jgi:hypothetical protein
VNPGNVEQPQAYILLTFSADSGAVEPPKSLLHPQFGLEAEVGIAPRLPSPANNSADFAAQSITILHHPPVSPTWILLKLLLKVSNGGG